jgi:uncharacterized protein YjdB
MKKLFLLFTMLGFAFLAKSQTDLIISEYVEGWGTNKAMELFNPTNKPISMATYRLTRYSNGQDVPPADIGWTFMLPNRVIQPYRSYVIVGDKRDPLGTGQEAPVWAQLGQRADTFACPIYTESKTMYFNGNDAVALEKLVGADWLVVDLFARWGAPAPALATLPGSATQIEAWTDVSPYFAGTGVAITADHTLIRKSSVKNGVTLNPALFNPLAEYDSLPANTFKNLGWHKFDGAPANSTPVINLSKSVFFVSPAADNGASLGNITASDTEGDALRYYVDYGNFVYKPSGNPLVPDKRYEPFGLNRNNGELTVVNKLGLLPVIKSVFYLETTVTDGYSQSETTDVTVIVAEPVTVINIGSTGGATSISTNQGTLQFIAEVFPAVTFDPTLRYMWKVSDENIASVSTTGLVTALKNGTVNVICAAVDGSGVEGTFQLTITGQTTSITNQEVKPAIYPNPVDGNQFRVSASKDIKTVIITDAASREVYKRAFNANVQSAEIELANVSKGVFLVSVIYNDNSRGVSKLVMR